MKILAYDCETTGLIARKHNILTLYCGVFVQDPEGKFQLVNELDLKIKPNQGDYYTVSPSALGVNKIDLVSHDKEALILNQAAEKLYYFLKQESNDGRNKLTGSGHNEPFDRFFVLENLLKEEIWRQYIDYHNLDTVPIARALKLAGKLPQDLRLNLKALASHFRIEFKAEDQHNARSDTHVHVKVLESLVSLMKS